MVIQLFYPWLCENNYVMMLHSDVLTAVLLVQLNLEWNLHYLMKDNSPRTFGREMEYSYTNKNTVYHMQNDIWI